MVTSAGALKMALVLLVGIIFYQNVTFTRLNSLLDQHRKSHSQNLHHPKKLKSKADGTNSIEEDTPQASSHDDPAKSDALPQEAPEDDVTEGEKKPNFAGSSKDDHVTATSLTTKSPATFYSTKSPKICIITYVPHKDNNYYATQFLSILYSSWRYVTDHPELARETKIKEWTPLTDLVIVDMLVYCAREACKQFPFACIEYKKETFNMTSLQHHCLYIAVEEHPHAASYGWVNSFIFAEHASFAELLPRYDWATRLDTDCLIAPPFLAWVPGPGMEVAIEYAHYSAPFNRQRLEYVAQKLKLRNQKVHGIGSSFYTKPEAMKEVGKLTVNLTVHISTNEFDQTDPGLAEIFNQTTNPGGIWPTWWRGVSLLYGTELALNHIIGNLSTGWVHGMLDQGTCGQVPINTMTELHCYQGDCQFHKFQFMEAVLHSFSSRSLDPRLLHFYDDKPDAGSMNMREWATFIAWHGAGHYVKHIREWTAAAMGFRIPECKDTC